MAKNVIPSLRPISYKSIEDRKIIEINGEKVIEFTTQAFDTKKSISFDQNNMTRLSPSLEGKPHLLAKILTGSEDNADMILHYNYVSNPYSIDKTFLFVLPNVLDCEKAINSGLNDKNSKGKDISSNDSKKELNKTINKKDKKRIMELMKQQNPSLIASLKNELLQKESGDINSKESNKEIIINSSGINESTGNIATLDDLLASLDFVRTPNMSQSEQYKAIDGKVVFGTNISNKRCSGDITATQGKTEMIRLTVKNLIKNKKI